MEITPPANTNSAASMTLGNNGSSTQQSQQPKSLEDELALHRQKWTQEIQVMNEQLKSLTKVDALLGTIYAQRQDAVDYFHAMMDVIIKQSKDYKKQSQNMFNAVKANGFQGIRYPNDTAIKALVEAELIDQKTVIDVLSNHCNFIKETIATIDNMIYGINQKIKLGEMFNGVKF